MTSPYLDRPIRPFSEVARKRIECQHKWKDERRLWSGEAAMYCVKCGEWESIDDFVRRELAKATEGA